jgi:glycerol-3-phosphate dehydrogenase (NAD(P)+)
MADAGHSVRIWARDPAVARGIERRHRNDKNLSGIVLPRKVRATTDPGEALKGADLVVVAVGAQAAGTVLTGLRRQVPARAVAVSLMKGIELGSGRRMSEVMGAALDLPSERLAAVSGPNLSREIAQRQPAATVVSSASASTAQAVARACTTPYLRPYINTDLVGVELCGAVKNVVAFAVGVAAGLGYDMNTQATLMTRGLAEMTRLGLAMGAEVETFAGLAGVGDLAATCLSVRSRNCSVGRRVGEGMALDEAVAVSGGTAESLTSSAAILALARGNGVEMPITAGVVGVVHHGQDVREMGEALLARPHRAEGSRYRHWR